MIQAKPEARSLYEQADMEDDYDEDAAAHVIQMKNFLKEMGYPVANDAHAALRNARQRMERARDSVVGLLASSGDAELPDMFAQLLARVMTYEQMMRHIVHDGIADNSTVEKLAQWRKFRQEERARWAKERDDIRRTPDTEDE
jgi:hypothetical protein